MILGNQAMMLAMPPLVPPLLSLVLTLDPVILISMEMV